MRRSAAAAPAPAKTEFSEKRERRAVDENVREALRVKAEPVLSKASAQLEAIAALPPALAAFARVLPVATRPYPKLLAHTPSTALLGTLGSALGPKGACGVPVWGSAAAASDHRNQALLMCYETCRDFFLG